MKILMLTPYLPYPPGSGGQIRTLNLLKYLSQSNDITLVALYKNDKEKAYASKLKEYCKEIYVCKRAEKPWQLSNILKSIFSFLPFLIVRNYSYEAHDVIRKLLSEQQFDVIHAETFYIMPHIPDTKVPVFLVEQTIEFQVYQHHVSTLPLPVRLALWIDILKLRFWEIFYWRKADVVATVSYSDKSIIQSCVPDNITYVIPNGAGDEMFVDSLPKKDLKKPTLLFIGNFFWLQNTEAAEYLIHKLFPKIKALFPSIQLTIAGQNVKTKLKAKPLDSLEILDLQNDDTDRIKELYRNASIFISPIFGPGGTRLKILAAMASGLPIVSTKTGIEGLEVHDGKEVLVANTPDEFVDKIRLLLENSELYEQLRAKSFKLVKDKYSWSEIAKKLELLYKSSMHE